MGSARRDRRPARTGVLAIAGVSSLLSAIAAVCVGRSGDAEPLPSDTHEVKGGAVPSEPVGTV